MGGKLLAGLVVLEQSLFSKRIVRGSQNLLGGEEWGKVVSEGTG